MARYGYARVSTQKETQKFDRQEDQLIAAGCEKVFMERVGGQSSTKPVQREMLEEMKAGDELVCVSIDRLGRSTVGILSLITELEERQIMLRSLKEGQLLGDESNAFSRFMISLLSSLAQLEVELTRERVVSGLEAAKRRGKRLGRPRKDKSVMDTAIRMWQSKDGYSVNEICEAVGISRQTLYNEIHRRGVTRD